MHIVATAPGARLEPRGPVDFEGWGPPKTQKDSNDFNAICIILMKKCLMMYTNKGQLYYLQNSKIYKKKVSSVSWGGAPLEGGAR